MARIPGILGLVGAAVVAAASALPFLNFRIVSSDLPEGLLGDALETLTFGLNLGPVSAETQPFQEDLMLFEETFFPFGDGDATLGWLIIALAIAGTAGAITLMIVGRHEVLMRLLVVGTVATVTYAASTSVAAGIVVAAVFGPLMLHRAIARAASRVLLLLSGAAAAVLGGGSFRAANDVESWLADALSATGSRVDSVDVSTGAMGLTLLVGGLVMVIASFIPSGPDAAGLPADGQIR